MQLFSKQRQRVSLGLSIFTLLVFISVFGASARVTQVTSADGITVQFTLSDLTVSETIRDNVRYHEVRYADSRWTNEPGNPKVPVTRLLLGIPATGDIEAVDVSVTTPYETRTGVRLVPVSVTSYQLPEGSSLATGSETNWPLVTSSSQRWEERGSAYESNTENAPYPGLPLARVVREGYIRSQRVIALALYPVQYFPKTRQLRLYSRFTINIRWRSNQLPVTSGQLKEGSGSSSVSSLETGNWKLETDSEVFEQAFSRQLLNAKQAAHFRAARRNSQAKTPSVPAAPTLVSNINNVPRYKLFVEETGVHAITAESLARDWGVELIGTHPARAPAHARKQRCTDLYQRRSRQKIRSRGRYLFPRT